MLCRIISVAVMVTAIWIAGSGIYAAKAAPDVRTGLDNAQAVAILAGLLLFSAGWTAFFCPKAR